MIQRQAKTVARQAFAIEDVVPHKGPMCLLDAVVNYDEETLQAAVTIRHDSAFGGAAGVPAWVGIEYMAQAIAAYSGVQRRIAGREVQVGFLVGTRRYDCNCSFFPIGSKLTVNVAREFQADNGLGCFNCEIDGDGIRVEASLNVYLPEDLDGFLDQ